MAKRIVEKAKKKARAVKKEHVPDDKEIKEIDKELTKKENAFKRLFKRLFRKRT